MVYMKQFLFALTLFLYCGLGLAQLKFGPGVSEAGDTLDTIGAIVDDDIITRAELNSAVADARRQLQGQNRQPPATDVLEPQILERLIMAKLQRSAAEREGIVVDDPTLNAAVESIARQNKMDLSQLRQALQRDGISYEAFRNDVREQVFVNRLRQKVVDSQITVSPQEVDNALRQFAGSGQVAQEYRISQILVAVPEAASPDQIDSARQKAEGMLAQLRQGADFRRLAVAGSDGREALEGGEIGWRSAAQLPSLFADAVIRLKPGEFTDIVRSPAGFHIIKLLELRSTNSGGAAADREAVQEALFRRKVEEEWELWLRRLRDEAYVEIRL